MKYPDDWNKLGNLQKGLTNKVQFSALLWQMRPSEKADKPGLKMPLSASCPLPALFCVSGEETGDPRDLQYLLLYTGHNDNGVAPYIASELAMLILSRYLEGTDFHYGF